MGFDVGSLLDERGEEGYELHRRHMNPQLPRVLHTIGFDTAYVGSSNLSKAAITDGLEWNVRLSATTHFAQIAKSKKLFDQYWNSSNFLAYDPERDAETLDLALQDAGGSGGSATMIQLSGLEVRPLPHQQIILDSLDRERRVYDRHRNLVIAATGTGKTVVAALDYARLCTSHVDRPRLLFVAHRKEILTQALQTYREVLGDASFGELYVDGERPSQWQHVFASIQSVYRTDSLPRAERRARVTELLDLVGLPGFERRSVNSLSGGQAQRVALARSLAPSPRLLLLDEPLSALDRSLRERLTVDLATILRGASATALYVTHDHDEAFTIADRVGLMRAGRLVQTGRPADLWARPADAGVAAFLGFTVIPDGARTWALGPRGLWVTAAGGPDPGPVPIVPRAGRVRSLGFQRGEPAARVDVPGWGTVRALIRSGVADGPVTLAPGDPVEVQVDPLGLVPLED